LARARATIKRIDNRGVMSAADIQVATQISKTCTQFEIHCKLYFSSLTGARPLIIDCSRPAISGACRPDDLPRANGSDKFWFPLGFFTIESAEPPKPLGAGACGGRIAVMNACARGLSGSRAEAPSRDPVATSLWVVDRASASSCRTDGSPSREGRESAGSGMSGMTSGTGTRRKTRLRTCNRIRNDQAARSRQTTRTSISASSIEVKHGTPCC
jgi:hypothetical protein